MKRCGSRLISSARAKMSSRRIRENCWLSTTCRSRDVTAMKKSPSLALRPGLKGELAGEFTVTCYVHESKTRTRRRHDRGRLLQLLSATSQPPQRSAPPRHAGAHDRHLRDMPPHPVEHDGRRNRA